MSRQKCSTSFVSTMKMHPFLKIRSFVYLALLFFVALFAVVNVMGNVWERRAQEHWAKTFGPIDDLQKVFPARSDNDPAIQLKKLATRLGIEFTVPHEDDQFSPIYMDAVRYNALKGDNGPIAKYIRKQLERPDARVDQPGDLISLYLKDYGNKLDAVRDHILTSPPVLWRQNLNGWDQDNTPDIAKPLLPGIVRLQKLIVTRALELTAHQNFEEAERYLDAGWRLNEGLRTHSNALLQLFALYMDHHWLGVIQKLPVGIEWTHKIAEHDYRESFSKAFQVDAWLLWRWRDVPLMDNGILDPVLHPYVRFCVAAHMEKEREEIASLRGLNPCNLHGDDFFDEPEETKWNLVEPERWPGRKKELYGRLIKLDIDRELTAKIIRAKHGFLPRENSEWSTACSDGIWEYRTLPDGVISIEYAAPLELPVLLPPVLPRSFVFSNPSLQYN